MIAPISSRALQVEDVDRLTTGVAVLDGELRVGWLNAALAELLEVGVRGVRGQSFAPLLDADILGIAARRARREQETVRVRGVCLATLQDREVLVDLVIQPLDAEHLLLEVHALAPRGLTPTPLSATLRGFAHEVKNPLAGLRGAAQLLKRRVGAAELEQLADMVIGEADRLATLADRLLNQDHRSPPGAVNMHALMERVTALLASEAEALRVLHDYDPSLPDVLGDADRLQQLLLNLARNALEAGARTLTLRTRIEHGVRLRERVTRSALRVDVLDDGAGIPAELRENLFQPLVSGRADGTGLGLALAQETAGEHGGELRCTSRPGATVFSLYLPLPEPPAGGAAAWKSAVDRSESATPAEATGP